MSHPFDKIFAKALKESTQDENQLLEAAEKLRQKGYRSGEIYSALKKFCYGFLEERDGAIGRDAVAEFSRHVDEE